MDYTQKVISSLPEEKIKELCYEADHWLSCHGSIMYIDSHLSHSPVTLLPSPFPRSAYDYCVSITNDFNELVDKTSRDFLWICQTFQEIEKIDDFVRRLLQIYRQTYLDQTFQPLCLGILRSDYILNQSSSHELHPLQVEMNTIASSFGALSELSFQLHNYLISRYNLPFDLSKFQPNDTLSRIANCIYQAHTTLTQKLNLSLEKPAILVIVQKPEGNFADQRHLEYYIWSNYHIPSVRYTLHEVYEHCSLDSNTHILMDKSLHFHYTVVYFRAGYTPNDYPTEIEWQGRLLICSSKSIQCPSISYQLVTFKKIQQEWAKPGILERFITPSQAANLRQCFAGLWPASQLPDQIISSVMSQPDHFVLKPQREGGGNNIWGENIKSILLQNENLSQYIIMQHIQCPAYVNCLIRKGEVDITPTLSELGVYGGYLSDGQNVYFNQSLGYLLRTKKSQVKEGGVASGYSVIDTPYFI